MADNGAMPPPIQSLSVNKKFEVQAKEILQANERNCLREPILIQILFERKLVSDIL